MHLVKKKHNSLKSLLTVFVRNFKKMFTVYKIFDAEISIDEIKANFPDFFDNNLSYITSNSSNGKEYFTILYKEELDNKVIYYHNDISLSSNVAIDYLNELNLKIINIKNKNHKIKESLLLQSTYRQEDIEQIYNLANNDIEDSKELYSLITQKISNYDKKWQYIDLFFDLNGKKQHIKVPKLAFIFYALDVRYNVDNLNDFNIPNWECVSKSGYKMSNDNCYHTDFWIGMGLTFKSAYPQDLFDNGYSNLLQEENRNFYIALVEELTELRYEIREQYLVFSSISVGAPTISKGRVLHYDLFKDDLNKVKPNDILILPNLGIKFEPAVLIAIKNGHGGVISEQGGSLAHLSILGRELNFPIFIEKNALQKYRFIQAVEINGNKKTISIN